MNPAPRRVRDTWLRRRFWQKEAVCVDEVHLPAGGRPARHVLDRAGGRGGGSGQRVHGGQAGPAGAGTSAVVVHQASRTGFGMILVTPKVGMALYTNPAGCSAACQSIWPPLLLPKGATTPTGSPCLATAKHGKKLQVTYHKLRLYTFTGDTGHSVNGDGVAGFHVAKLVKGCTATH
jgi:predicted lipoprotein with Yx(FWY)xxD motif